MKRKLIEITKIGDLKCDNPNCDYKVHVLPSDYESWINKDCPKCGENLLTVEDYKRFVASIRAIWFINKWFGWIMWFVPRRVKPVEHVLETHEEIRISKPSTPDK